MEYHVDYQFLPKGREVPLDQGEVIGLHATDTSGLVILPNIGDFVQVSNQGDRANFKGKVRSRVFYYNRSAGGDVLCNVNIVIAETDDDWAALSKS